MPSITTQLPSSSLVDDELCCGSGVLRVLSGLLSFLLDTQKSCDSFCPPPCCVQFFPRPSSHRLLLAPSRFGFSDVSKSWKNIAASSRRTLQDVPQRDLQFVWLQQIFHHFNIHFDLGAIFPNNLPLRPSPFFHWVPAVYRLLLVFLLPSITCSLSSISGLLVLQLSNVGRRIHGGSKGKDNPAGKERRCTRPCSMQPAFTAWWKNGKTVRS